MVDINDLKTIQKERIIAIIYVSLYVRQGNNVLSVYELPSCGGDVWTPIMQQITFS